MSHVTQVSCIPHTTSSAWAPKAHKQSHYVRTTIATLLRQTIATLLRQTVAILLRQILTSNPLWARACLRVQNSRFTG